tara:strand:+ start:4039 stop:5826 length:1788 start_codon:yes stop_codon:yes gene_type:complete
MRSLSEAQFLELSNSTINLGCPRDLLECGIFEGISHKDASKLGGSLYELYKTKGAEFANEWLSDSIERIKLLDSVSVMRPHVEKEAERQAKRGGKSGNKKALLWLRTVVSRLRYCDTLITDLTGEELAAWTEKKSAHFEKTFFDLGLSEGKQKAKKFMAESLKAAGVEFDKWDETDKVVSMAARMITPEWWARQAKKQWRTVENILRECGEVHNGASPYLSRWGLNKFRKQQEANEAFLKGWEAENQHGEKFTLEDLANRSVSNPFIRRGELMGRIRGTEELAVELGNVGYFLTLTAPSKYHAVRKSGSRVSKFYDAACPTPRESQAYLCNVWAKIRAQAKREEIHFYGIRVVEPHHDATPHWHIMVFGEAGQMANFVEIFKAYAMEEDADEKGADDARYDVTFMNPAEGTAAGYIAKYICKSIDGSHIEKDLETGKSAADMAENITGWARRHGIRQFQFFGSASVTVWRELRLLKKDISEKIRPIYDAANDGQWKEYTKLMGGFCAGRNQTLKPYYSDTEENQYGELCASIKGVSLGIETFVTRFYDWTLQRVGAGSVSVTGSLSKRTENPFSRTRVNNCTPPSGGGNYQPIYQ